MESLNIPLWNIRPTKIPQGRLDLPISMMWIIRNNLFRNIRAAPGQGLAGPAILVWKGAVNTLSENNLFLNCQRGIAYGFDATRLDDNIGGIIRNNMFDRTSSQSGDVGIYFSNSVNTEV